MVGKAVIPVKALGRIARRITIEVDQDGLTRIEARVLDSGGIVVNLPMTALEMAAILSQAVARNLTLILSGVAKDAVAEAAPSPDSTDSRVRS